MIGYNLKLAWRNLLGNKLFSLINICGLAIGLASCTAVYLFIKDEYSYDRQNRNADRIYRVITNAVNDDGSKTISPVTPPALSIALQSQLPEIEQVVRLFPPASAWGSRFYVRSGDKKFIEENIYRADSSIFDVFSIPFVKGSRESAMSAINSVILTESLAKKYFGHEDPIGKILDIDDWEPYQVTAVIKDFPDNVHFTIDMLVPLKSLDQSHRLSSHWGWNSFYTYVKLRQGISRALFNKKIQQVFRANNPNSKNEITTQPLTSIHLHSNLTGELRPNSNVAYSYIFGAISLLVLLSACINYINLSTARATIRVKEIGIRKISGAGNSTLLFQFLTEAVLSSCMAAGLALAADIFFLRLINTITGKQLGLLKDNFTIPGVFLFAIITGLAAGLYPALYLSLFNPVQAIKSEKLAGGINQGMRKVLVVTQFSISIALIAGMIIVHQQLDYMQQAKLGLQKDHVIIVNDIGFLSRGQVTLLKHELINVKGVQTVAAADGVPGGYNWNRNVRCKGQKNLQPINFLSVDNDFIPAYSMEIKEGRNFSSLYPADTENAIILNETAVKKLAVPAPVAGQQLVWNQNERTGEITYATICGVVKDFHFSSMKNEIQPFAFMRRNNRQWVFAIRLAGEDMRGTITAIKNTWDKNRLNRPFQYTFLDEIYAKLYVAEMNFKTIFTGISIVAAIIACLGLFGLSLFITRQRTKEVSIRKILGASTGNILFLLSKIFVQLIIIASVISFPITWWLASSWLRGYAYRVSIGWRAFALGDLLVLAAALLTICFHTAKAAVTSPVKSLRTE